MRKVLLHHGVRFLRDVAGYASGGLTQPTGTKWVTDTGKMPWRSLTQLSENKTYPNKVGWDKRSVPNVFIKFIKIIKMLSISCWIFAWSRPLDRGGFPGYIGAE